MERFQANGTVYPRCIGNTGMALYRFFLHTDATAVTMCMILSTSYTTDPTGGTVILTLVFIIQQDTGGTPVGAQRCAATNTVLCRPLFFLT
jgi:hypothetical protein